jgi:hypothetical protein
MRYFKASILLIAALAGGGFVYSLITCPKARDAIIGAWQQRENNGWDVIEFRLDGTFLHHDAFGTHSMTYSWAGQGRIQFQYERFGTNGGTVSETMVFGVSPKRNALSLTNLNEWGNNEVTRYRRLKRRDLPKLDIDDFKGAQLVALPATCSPEKVITSLFENSGSGSTKVTTHKILQVVSVVTSRGMPLFVDVDTNVGRKGVYLEFDRPQIGGGPLRGWWCRVEETHSSPESSAKSTSHE